MLSCIKKNETAAMDQKPFVPAAIESRPLDDFFHRPPQIGKAEYATAGAGAAPVAAAALA